MASTILVDKIDPQSGTALEIGSSGDTISFPTGTTLSVAGSTSGLPDNTPSFFASNSGANQDISDATNTKVTLGNEIYDTNSAFANSKFTVPSGEAGKYCFVFSGDCHSLAVSNLNIATLHVYKNGSSVSEIAADFRDNPVRRFAVTGSIILDLSASDYIELYVNIDDTSGSPRIVGDSGFTTYLGGYKVLGA